MNSSLAKFLLVLVLLPILGSCNNLNVREKIGNKPSKIKKKANKTMPCQSSCLRLIRDKKNRKNSLGNPIYILEAYEKGQKIYAFQAVTGRTYSQNRNRDRSGSEAPLPDGKYIISSKIVAGLLVETGETFIPVYPTFSTNRTALGIHYDPSYNKNNGEDGTAGCIGLTKIGDRDKINQFVVQYKPKELIVLIQ